MLPVLKRYKTRIGRSFFCQSVPLGYIWSLLYDWHSVLTSDEWFHQTFHGNRLPIPNAISWKPLYFVSMSQFCPSEGRTPFPILPGWWWTGLLSRECPCPFECSRNRIFFPYRGWLSSWWEWGTRRVTGTGTCKSTMDHRILLEPEKSHQFLNKSNEIPDNNRFKVPALQSY